MCGYDCLANSIYTIVVAGADRYGMATEYSERCSAVMVTAYSTDIVIILNNLQIKCQSKIQTTFFFRYQL